MNDAMLNSILLRLGELEKRPRVRFGVVTTASPLAVALGGSDVPHPDCKHLASYTPTLGDNVSVLTFGGDIIVLGEIA